MTNCHTCKFNVNNHYAVVRNNGNLSIYNSDSTLRYSYNGTNNIMAMDWNSDGTLLMFTYSGYGLVLYNWTTNSATNFYNYNDSTATF